MGAVVRSPTGLCPRGVTLVAEFFPLLGLGQTSRIIERSPQMLTPCLLLAAVWTSRYCLDVTGGQQTSEPQLSTENKPNAPSRDGALFTT